MRVTCRTCASVFSTLADLCGHIESCKEGFSCEHADGQILEFPEKNSAIRHIRFSFVHRLEKGYGARSAEEVASAVRQHPAAVKQEQLGDAALTRETSPVPFASDKVIAMGPRATAMDEGPDTADTATRSTTQQYCEVSALAAADANPSGKHERTKGVEAHPENMLTCCVACATEFVSYNILQQHPASCTKSSTYQCWHGPGRIKWFNSHTGILDHLKDAHYHSQKLAVPPPRPPNHTFDHTPPRASSSLQPERGPAKARRSAGTLSEATSFNQSKNATVTTLRRDSTLSTESLLKIRSSLSTADHHEEDADERQGQTNAIADINEPDVSSIDSVIVEQTLDTTNATKDHCQSRADPDVPSADPYSRRHPPCAPASNAAICSEAQAADTTVSPRASPASAPECNFLMPRIRRLPRDLPLYTSAHPSPIMTWTHLAPRLYLVHLQLLRAKVHDAATLEKYGFNDEDCTLDTEVETAPPVTIEEPKLLAASLACIVVETTTGKSEIVRLSLVDYLTGRILLDVLIEPDEPVLDWRTSITGIDASTIAQAKARGEVLCGWPEAREQLFRFVDEETIVVGHCLPDVLKALHVVREVVVDSSILTTEVLQHRADAPVALPDLCDGLLGRQIRNTTPVLHDALEDAFAAREIVLHCVSNPVELRSWAQRYDGATAGPENTRKRKLSAVCSGSGKKRTMVTD